MNQSTTLRRLGAEQKLIHAKIKSGELDIVFHNTGSDLTTMKFTIKGPIGSVYEGGSFDVCFNYPQEYPIKPPNVFFLTNIWNCNISYDNGAVCLETLQKDWTPSVRSDRIIYSIYTLMLCPNPDSAFHDYIGAQYKNNKDLYDETARYWTTKYAGGQNQFPEFDTKVRLLMNEGFGERKSVEKLSIFNWDVDKSREMVLRELNEQF